MSIKEEIIKQLQTVIKEQTAEEITIHLEHPANPDHGDYASNIALVISKKLKKNPMEVAGNIASSYQPRRLRDLVETRRLASSYIEKIEVAKPGFINFYLSKDYFFKRVEEVRSGKFLDAAKNADGKKIMVEFTDPNPFKEFHIGHLYSNIVGEAICRLLEATGAEVKRVCYQGDVGLHVAKSIWGIRKSLELRAKSEEEISKEVSLLEQKSLEERVKFLGEAYALGTKTYEEDEKAKEEIREINKKVYQKSEDIYRLYEKGKQWSLDYFSKIYDRLGTKFFNNYFESDAGEIGLKIVKENLKKGIFKENDGAVIFPGEEHQASLHTRVFINSLGLPTYEAKELGLAPTKYKDFPYDESIIITGNEINEYFKVLIQALSIVNPELGKKTKHISHGMVRLPSGKMSSRTGDVIIGEWLLDEAHKKAADKIKSVSKEALKGVMKDQIAEEVGIGAVKYALLKHTIGQDIVFDFEEAINFEGDAGPYLQYTYVRTRSVLGKVQKLSSYGEIRIQHTINPNPEEFDLLRTLAWFDEIIQEAAQKYSPHILCNYLFDVAQKFNLFYQKHSILGTKESDTLSEQTRDFRIILTTGVGNTLKEGLHLLGIKAPKKM